MVCIVLRASCMAHEVKAAAKAFADLFKHAGGAGHDFIADAIAGEHADVITVGHSNSPLVSKSIGIQSCCR